MHESIARVGDPSGDGKITCSVGVNGGEMVEIDPKAHREKAKALRKQAGEQAH